MTQDEIVKMARETGLVRTGDKWVEPARWGVTELVHFAALVAAAEREKVAAWMLNRSYATGHGDAVEDLLKELESEREACAGVCDGLADIHEKMNQWGQHKTAETLAQAIRARGQA